MPSVRHFPLTILGLILVSALAVLVLGFHFAKQEQTTETEQDRRPLTQFASRLLGEIGSLDSLYQSHLVDIRDRISTRSSNIEISSVCRNIVGVEQATVFREGEDPIHLDLREGDRSSPLPLPRASGDSTASDGGIIINVAAFGNTKPGDDVQWIHQPGHPPYFAARLDYKTILLLRINPSQTAMEMDAALADWLLDAFAPVEVAGLAATLQNPAGEIIASTGTSDPPSSPDLLLPVPTTFGEWKISSWNKRETITTYNLPILVGSAVLSLVLVIAGLFGYSQQQRAFRLAEQRASFVNRVSHELRTPMTNILLNTDLLSDSFPDDDLPQAKRLQLIREEAGRLSRLIENVLTFSGRGQTSSPADDSRQILQAVPCDINQLVDSVLSHFAPILRRKNINIRQSQADSPVFALADADAFRQVIGNLLSNVEKYAADGGECEIEIQADPDKSIATISISDHGPGIPASETSRIFQPFVRLSDATTEGVSGTGLGLAIARDLAESMNGTLELDPGNKEAHPGSRFVLALPLSAENIVSMAS